MNPPPEILLVTGMSGAGKSTVLKTLEDLGWEVVDNLPLSLLDRLLNALPPEGTEGMARPLALGIGARTRDFDADQVVDQVERLRGKGKYEIGTLFLECDSDELARRYDETRRRHPLAQDRPARDGIERERELLAPLKRWANRLIDTSSFNSQALAQQIRAAFSRAGLSETILSVMSFGFARGLPNDADLVFDMRFLRNPHWEPALRPGTGLYRRRPGLCRCGAADRGAAAPARPPLHRDGEILCYDRIWLYRRETPVGAYRGAGRRAVA